MQKRILGTSGIETSVIGLGTWAIGGWCWGGTDEQDSIDAIHAAMDEGVNLIDTAPAYGLGLSEEIVGKAIAGRREQVVLATKCGLVWHTQKGNHFFDQDGKPVHRYLGADSIRHELELSLKRMNTDYIDLYQTHWQDPTTPISETMSALLELKGEGKIRAIGVSNVNVEQLREYLAVGPVDSAQEKYSMLDRKLEADLIPYCIENNVSLLAYSPLVLGLLSGKIGPEREFPDSDMRKTNPRFSKENRQRVKEMLNEIEPIAQKHSLTMAQLVTAWTLSQPGVTFALVGARNRQQAVENAAAGNAALSAEEVRQITDVVYERAAAIG